MFEGVEGCGKTTQIQRLYPWLSQQLATIAAKDATDERRFDLSQLAGHPLPVAAGVPPEPIHQELPLLVTREPGGTELCQSIRRLLLTPTAEPMQNRTELLLYAADRAQHVENLLKPALAAGTLILCDRYTDSTIAYQGYGRGLDRSLIHQLNQIATGGLTSDLTLWLDVDVEIGLSRAQQRGVRDRIEQADLEFHRRVQQGFQELAQAQPQRIVRIDASGEVDAVAAQVQSCVMQRLEEWYGLAQGSDVGY